MEISRRRPIVKSRVAAGIETVVVQLAIGQPSWGQIRVSNEVPRHGLSILSFFARNVLTRHDLENRKKRLAALEAKVARDGAVQTHQGHWFYGKAPMQTFIDTLPVAKKKSLQAA